MQIKDFPHLCDAQLRYSDTDRQGHINNAVYMSMLEIARVEILYNADDPLLPDGCDFVLARVEMDFVAEMTWPGKAEIATGIIQLGRSSIQFVQGIFKDGQLCARARSVSVMTDNSTRRSTPLPDASRAVLERLLLPAGYAISDKG